MAGLVHCALDRFLTLQPSIRRKPTAIVTTRYGIVTGCLPTATSRLWISMAPFRTAVASLATRSSVLVVPNRISTSVPFRRQSALHLDESFATGAVRNYDRLSSKLQQRLTASRSKRHSEIACATWGRQFVGQIEIGRRHEIAMSQRTWLDLGTQDSERRRNTKPCGRPPTSRVEVPTVALPVHDPTSSKRFTTSLYISHAVSPPPAFFCVPAPSRRFFRFDLSDLLFAAPSAPAPRSLSAVPLARLRLRRSPAPPSCPCPSPGAPAPEADDPRPCALATPRTTAPAPADSAPPTPCTICAAPHTATAGTASTVSSPSPKVRAATAPAFRGGGGGGGGVESEESEEEAFDECGAASASSPGAGDGGGDGDGRGEGGPAPAVREEENENDGRSPPTGSGLSSPVRRGFGTVDHGHLHEG
ncbi:hypothetical protein C2E23DRAFT_924619 [Lenzites betulinus]|nr:hypothetical protein C2E23DRAFT_924619 [Lenzites betulinus]